MPDLGPSRCIIALVSVGDTSGLRFQCPSRCTEVQIYLYNTSGWANIGHFRCSAKNCQNKIHRNSRFSSNPDVFQLISRDYTYISSQRTPARINLTLISREYTCFPSQSTPAQAGFTVICAEIASGGSMWQRGLLNLIDSRGRYIGIVCFCGVPMYSQ